jgi:hypothetical protein
VDQLADLRERLAARRPAGANAALPTAPATPPSAATAPVIETSSVDATSTEPASDLPAPATERLTLADARARYRAIYQHMQSINRLVASRINPGDIIAVDGEAITFGLPHKIQVDKLAAGSDAHRALTDAVTQVFGRAYAVHCVHMPEAEDRLRAQPTRRSHLLDEAIKLGAQPL